MAVYAQEKNKDITAESFYIYGSSRVGELDTSINMRTATVSTFSFSRIRGIKRYEMSNHLGNVMVVVSDRKVYDGNVFKADLVSTTDYYAFGMVMSDRSYNTEGYRFGFNGKENDNEVKGTGNSVDFGARVLDTRLGRFLSVDPKEPEYPWQSTYAYAANSPISLVDIEGKGPGDPPNVGTTTLPTIKLPTITQEDIDIRKLPKPSAGRALWETLKSVVKNGASAVALTVVLVFVPSNFDQKPWCERCHTFEELVIERVSTNNGDLTLEEAKTIRERVMQGKGTANDFLRLKEANTKAGLTAPAKKSDRVSALPPQLQRRVKLSQQTKDDIIRSAPMGKDENGQWRFIGPDDKFIPGDKVTVHPDDPNLKIYGTYDFGHEGGNKAWKDYQDNKDNWNKTREEIIKEQDDPSKYRLEAPKPNRSNGAKAESN